MTIRARSGGAWAGHPYARIGGAWVDLEPSGPARDNLLDNPSFAVDATGWTSSSAGWVRVTDLVGMPRATGWRLTNPAGSGYVRTPIAPASPGVTYTGSMYLKNSSQFGTTRPMWLAWSRSVGGDDFSVSGNAAMPDGFGGIYRPSLTGTAPANTTGVSLIIDTLSPGIDPGVSKWEVTGALIEESATLGDYID